MQISSSAIILEKRKKSLPKTQFEKSPTSNAKKHVRVLRSSSRSKGAATAKPTLKMTPKVIGLRRVGPPEGLKPSMEEDSELDEINEKSMIETKQKSPAVMSATLRQTRLEFQGRLNFSQEDNKMELDEMITESKKKIKAKEI